MRNSQAKPDERETAAIFESLQQAGLLPETDPAQSALDVGEDAFYLFEHLDETSLESKNAVAWLRRLFEFYRLLSEKRLLAS